MEHILICCVCLGDNSEDADEIIQCDNCGVTVHEGERPPVDSRYLRQAHASWASLHGVGTAAISYSFMDIQICFTLPTTICI